MSVAVSHSQLSGHEVVKRYFEALNNSDVQGITDLFGDRAQVFNLSFSPIEGKAGVQNFCQEFFEQTTQRNFQILSVAFANQQVMAHWSAALQFRSGAKVGSLVLETGFPLRLEGVNVFIFKDDGVIDEMKIFHETTSIAQKAEELEQIITGLGLRGSPFYRCCR